MRLRLDLIIGSAKCKGRKMNREEGPKIRVCNECGQGYMGFYVDRLCPRCRHKFLEKDEVLQLQSNISGDSYVDSFTG